MYMYDDADAKSNKMEFPDSRSMWSPLQLPMRDVTGQAFGEPTCLGIPLYAN